MKNRELLKILVALVAICTMSFVFISCGETNETFFPNDTSKTSLKQNDESKAKVSVKQVRYIDDETVNGDFEIRSGTLHFKSAKIYFETLARFAKMKPEERLAASKAMKFKSLLEVQQDFVSEIENIDSKGKEGQILKKYADILSIVENSVNFVNNDVISAALINRKGVVYLGKSLRYYKGLEQTNIENGDETLLNRISNSENVKTSQYLMALPEKKPNARPMDVCPHFYGTKTNGNNTQVNCADCYGGGGNRAVVLRIYAYTNDNGNGTFDVWPYAKGEAMRTYWWGGSGSWYPYTTNNDLGSYWHCSVTSNVGETLVSVADYAYSNNYSVIDYTGGIMTFSNYPSSFNTSFNFTYNGSSYYHSGGIPPPGVVAGCF